MGEGISTEVRRRLREIGSGAGGSEQPVEACLRGPDHPGDGEGLRHGGDRAARWGFQALCVALARGVQYLPANVLLTNVNEPRQFCCTIELDLVHLYALRGQARDGKYRLTDYPAITLLIFGRHGA
jgi:hypothetical protein